jgi:diguanylate cyclase (GGDEF)-like protein
MRGIQAGAPRADEWVILSMSTLSRAKTSLLLLLVIASVSGSVWMLGFSGRAGAIVSVLGGGSGYLLLLAEWRREERRRAFEACRREVQRELIESLQATRSEAEAHGLVKRHLERVVARSYVTVLTRNNGENRLQATTKLDPESPLARALEEAEPSTCLAVRLGKPHARGFGDDPLLDCSLCGALPAASTCVPSVVGGEVIGSVLVQREGALDGVEDERVLESVTQAAPVLANLRNLALAETRAATDALTGLPNSRALRDTLKRMIAHASRTLTPFSIILLDLDHFKRINDSHGHDRGDDALAAVGDVLSSTVRASDYAGRYGGEEFLVLLPDTDRDGSLIVGEKIRQAVSRVRVHGLDRPLSCSAGVATLAVDGGDEDALLRLADRALYAAKAAGRNRVEAAGLSVAPAS